MSNPIEGFVQRLEKGEAEGGCLGAVFCSPLKIVVSAVMAVVMGVFMALALLGAVLTGCCTRPAKACLAGAAIAGAAICLFICSIAASCLNIVTLGCCSRKPDAPPPGPGAAPAPIIIGA